MAEKLNRIANFLLFIIFFTYLGLILALHGLPETNFVNDSYRQVFLQEKITRVFFFLNSPGDDRLEYLNPENNALIIELDYQSKRDPEFFVEEMLEFQLEEFLDIEVALQITEDSDIPSIDNYSSNQVNDILETTSDIEEIPNQKKLHVLFLSNNSEIENEIELYGTDTIVFYKDKLDDLRFIDNTEQYQKYSLWLLLNGIGKQLGFNEFEDENLANCVMFDVKAKLDTDKQFYRTSGIPDTFCSETQVKLDDYRNFIL